MKINASFDSETKAFEVDIDGNVISNVNSFSYHTWENCDDETKGYVQLSQRMKYDDGDSSKVFTEMRWEFDMSEKNSVVFSEKIVREESAGKEIARKIL